MDLREHVKITLGKLLDIRNMNGECEFRLSARQLGELLEDGQFRLCLIASVENEATFNMEVIGLKITSQDKAVV